MNLFKYRCRLSLLLALLAVPDSLLAQAVPPINQCRTQWTLTNVQEMNFGGFSVEAGTATITMDSNGALTTSGLVSLSSSIPVTTWTVDVTNTLSTACASYGFSLDLPRPPQPLRLGGGNSIPFDNIRFSAPAYGLNNATFPQTIAANAGNTAPFTMTIYGEISPTAPQAGGEYSRRLTVEFQQSVSRERARSDVRATSIVPLVLSEIAGMDFGTVAGGPSPGTVVLDVGNGRAVTGDAQALASGPGSAATFEVTGEVNEAYAVSFSNGVLSDGGGQTMTVSNFTHNASGTIPGAGSEQFQVGATLNLGSNQASGSYSTSNGGGSPFTVTINYN